MRSSVAIVIDVTYLRIERSKRKTTSLHRYSMGYRFRNKNKAKLNWRWTFIFQFLYLSLADCSIGLTIGDSNEIRLASLTLAPMSSMLAACFHVASRHGWLLSRREVCGSAQNVMTGNGIILWHSSILISSRVCFVRSWKCIELDSWMQNSLSFSKLPQVYKIT